MFSRSTRFGASCARETRELFAEAQMRSDDGERFRVEIRHVDGVANGPFEERGANRLGDFDADAFLRLDGGGAEMRGENKVRRFAQRRIGRKRLRFENIERRRRHVPERNASASADSSMSPPRAQLITRTPRFVFASRARIEQMMRLRRERGVQGDEIRRGQEIVEFLDQLDLKRARAGGGEIRIVGRHAHSEGDRAPAQFAADPAHPDDAERLVEKLRLPDFSGPICPPEHRIGLRNFSGHAKQEGEGVFRGGNRVSARRVHHDHAAPRGFSTSTLSIPTPARPTTRSFDPAFKTAAVILVWLRTTTALKSGMISTSAASLKPVCTVTSKRRQP